MLLAKRQLASVKDFFFLSDVKRGQKYSDEILGGFFGVQGITNHKTVMSFVFAN